MNPSPDILASQGQKSPSVHSSPTWPILNQQELISPLSQQTPSLSLSSEDSPGFEGVSVSEFVNDFDEIRLKLIRGKLDLNRDLDRKKCILAYQKWVTDDNYMVLRKTDRDGTVEYHACKARKRGNDIDAYRISRKLGVLKDSIMEYVQSGERLRSTSAVYVTGTIDPRLVGNDLEYAWQYLGYWFNMFITSLRKRCARAVAEKHGKERAKRVKIRVYRSWEATGKGWPHFHAILCFEGFSWPTFKDSKSRWRVNDKQVFEDSWGFGWIDVGALTPGTARKSTERVVWYVSKYVGKGGQDLDYQQVGLWPMKRLLTESILWYYGKRSFSVSRGLVRVSDHPDDLKTPISTIQTNLEGEVVSEPGVVWEFVGIARRKDTELNSDDWVKVYAEPPDWVDLCWKPSDLSVRSGWIGSWGT